MHSQMCSQMVRQWPYYRKPEDERRYIKLVQIFNGTPLKVTRSPESIGGVCFQFCFGDSHFSVAWVRKGFPLSVQIGRIVKLQ